MKINIDELATYFQKAKKTTSGGYTVLCPCHDDHNPSGSLYIGDDGETHYKCFAAACGAGDADIIKRLGLKPTYTPQITREHIYTNENGEPIAKKEIKKKQDGSKGCVWYRYGSSGFTMGLKGLKMPLYALPDVIAEKDTVFFAEGEKDAETLKRMGFTGTTTPNGGAAAWRENYNQYISGKNVVIISDNDDTGKKYAETIARAALPIAKSVKIIDPCAIYEKLPEKGDISDIVQYIGIDETKTRLEQELEKAEPKRTAPPTEGKQRFTPELLDKYFKENGISVRKNVIAKEYSIKGFTDENREDLLTNIVPLLYFKLSDTYKAASKDNIQDAIGIIASSNAYNPVLEILAGYEWDGKDHLQELYAVMRLPEDDTLSRILVKKWLCQCIALQYNNTDKPFGGEGVLTLQGAQSAGKTSLFRKLSLADDDHPELFKEGICVDFRDKDSYIRAVSCWITELGEIESTFKSDVERLKAFITQSRDEYRLPYGRVDDKQLRRTSLCGSCNSTEFLVDETGNRRFWTVPLPEIMSYDEIQRLNVLQLWKQIQTLVNENLNCFRLTRDELAALTERNAAHEKKLKGQHEIEDILSRQSGDGWTVTWEYMTVTDFKTCHSEALRSYSSQQISKVLDRLHIETKQMRLAGSSFPSKVRKLPRFSYTYQN